MMQPNLFESEELEDEIPNPFYDSEAAEAERLAYEEIGRELQGLELEKQRQMESEGLEYRICCAHVSKVDGSAYACQVLDRYEPRYVVYADGLPKGVEPKRCDCDGKSNAWRGGELVNKFFDEDEKGVSSP